ncbi:MAG: hypothetical protein J0H99_24270, partial [Rhodospirillales bacterium]|nr:hypothetical protein [Rhodospirillales bacterium]
GNDAAINDYRLRTRWPSHNPPGPRKVASPLSAATAVAAVLRAVRKPAAAPGPVLKPGGSDHLEWGCVLPGRPARITGHHDRHPARFTRPRSSA